MKLHLEPLAIAANVTQTASCRLDTVLLTFGFLVMQYQKLTDIDDLTASTSIISSLEKRWMAADQDIFIATVIVNSFYRAVLESVHTILTQPRTPVSFRGMCIVCYSISGNSGNFRCFPFPENSGTPTFPISGNSGLRRFLLLVIRSCISPFTCDSVVSPCFMLLSSLMYSGLSLYPVHPYSTP